MSLGSGIAQAALYFTLCYLFQGGNYVCAFFLFCIFAVVNIFREDSPLLPYHKLGE